MTRDKHGRFTQAELDTVDHGWGYGSYRWQVATDVSQLGPEHVLGLFTYGQDPAYGHREIDIEASGWGTTPVTWDYTTWANGHDAVARTRAPAGPSSQQIDCSPGRLTWTSRDATVAVIATATATGADVPVPYDESIGLTSGCAAVRRVGSRHPTPRVVISSFRFTPATAH